MTVKPCVVIDLVQLHMNFGQLYALWIQKSLSQSAGAGMSLHLQPLQQRYCENLGSPASVCVMRHHYSVMYMQSLYTIDDLIAVG